MKLFSKKSPWLLPVAIVAASILIFALMNILAPAPKKKSGPSKAMLVNAVTVQKHDIVITIPSQGSVTPHVRTLLTSEVSGAVIQVSDDFVNGGFVRKGELLLKFDDRNYLAAVKKAEADVARTNMLLIQQKGMAQVAYRQWKKSRAVKRSPEALSLLLHKPQLKQAQANFDFAKAELEKVKGDLAKTEIRAPFDGIIKKKFIDYAQYAVPGSNLAELVAIDFAQVRLAIPQDRLAYLNLPGIADRMASAASTPTDGSDSAQNTGKPTPVQHAIPVTLTSHYGDLAYHWSAKIVRTEELFDDTNHSLYAIAKIDDPYMLKANAYQRENQRPLLLGTYVEASIQGQKMHNIITLPRHVLRAGDHVWVIDKSNRLRNRKLNVLRIGGDTVYVTSGLDNGERVCLTHVGEVVPGTIVRVADTTSTDVKTASR